MVRPRIFRDIALCLTAAWLGSCAMIRAHDTAVGSLREVQMRIQQVVERSLPACVAVSDGIGFGSGVIVSRSGLLLTAGHVVNTGKNQLEIFFADGRIVPARLLGYNLDIDAAMLQITEPGPWPFVPIAPSTQHVQIGDWLVSLGHSGGYEVGRKPPVRTGRLIERRGHLLVTDAVLIGGDSGGPLFDLDGNLVAIHSSIGDTIAENRHVAIDYFRRDWKRMAAGQRWGRLPELESAGPPSEPPLGQTENPSEATLRLLGVVIKDVDGRVVVQRVLPDSPAARVGIKPGDAMVSLDGAPIHSVSSAQALFQRKSAGQSAQLNILRNGRTLQLQIILDRLE